MLIRWVSRLLIVLGCLMTLLGAAYIGFVQYLISQESASPSTSRVLVLKDGRRIPLRQPTSVPLSKPPTSIPRTPTAIGAVIYSPVAVATEEITGGTPVASEQASEAQVLPPVRLYMPGISTDWPVVLSNGKQLPRFKGIGWLLGSAYPGAPGNMVLFGHFDGEYATLTRLKELKPGDIFSVFTNGGEYRYRVRSSFETTPDDVGVMAPTDSATATLVTCSGRWDHVESMYDHRLVVTADYLSESLR